MRKWKLGSKLRDVSLSTAILAVVFAGNAFAVSSISTSPNYQVSETEFGSSSRTENCSGQYCAQASIGDPTSGESKSTSSTASFGEIKQEDPLLEVIVDPGVSNLGVLTSETTASKTMVVRVRNYLSNGYVLQITGDSPKYAGHNLATPSSPTSATAGSEQFGINVAANTSPNVGASPVQVPSDQFSFGRAETGYDTPNQFKYSNGDIVARSDTESGRTDYTISFIVNISNMTPAGRYSGDFSAVVTPVY